MEDVNEIIKTKGFYYIPTEVLYTDFVGPKYIVATDDPQFKQKHPELDESRWMCENCKRLTENDKKELMEGCDYQKDLITMLTCIMIAWHRSSCLIQTAPSGYRYDRGAGSVWISAEACAHSFQGMKKAPLVRCWIPY